MSQLVAIHAEIKSFESKGIEKWERKCKETTAFFLPAAAAENRQLRIDSLHTFARTSPSTCRFFFHHLAKAGWIAGFSRAIRGLERAIAPLIAMMTSTEGLKNGRLVEAQNIAFNSCTYCTETVGRSHLVRARSLINFYWPCWWRCIRDCNPGPRSDKQIC